MTVSKLNVITQSDRVIENGQIRRDQRVKSNVWNKTHN